MESVIQQFLPVAVALCIGLLIGVERGWQERSRSEGQRIAGIRTFGLIGLLGGLWALLGHRMGPLVLAIAFAVLAAILIVAHLNDVKKDQDVGITTVLAAMVTFALGALAVEGYLALSAAGAVVTTILLSMKPVLHRWLQRLRTEELYSGLKLLLISLVILPVLPNTGFGPWQALNPYLIWWMVVLIAGISFAAYISIQLVGTRKGILATGLLGGLASSTATTIHLSRLARDKTLQVVATSGIIISAATMFPRVFIEVMVINHQLLPYIWLPLFTMLLVSIIATLLLRPRDLTGNELEPPAMTNPMELMPAIKFGLLLAVIMLLSRALQIWFGETGIYILAAVSGLADVDAITLTLSNMAKQQSSPQLASQGIILAVLVNTLIKGLLACWIAGLAMAKKILPTFLIIVLSGIVSLNFVAH